MTIDLRGTCPLLAVFDMPASLRFYRDLLGFTIVQAAPERPPLPDHHGWAWLRHGTAELMLNTLHDPDEPRPAAPDPGRFAAHEDTSLYFGSPDVDAVYRHLRAAGIEVAPPKDAPYGMRQLYLRDPDGYLLCFQWPVQSAVPATAPVV